MQEPGPPVQGDRRCEALLQVQGLQVQNNITRQITKGCLHLFFSSICLWLTYFLCVPEKMKLAR